jgi:hypothetical protein
MELAAGPGLRQVRRAQPGARRPGGADRRGRGDGPGAAGRNELDTRPRRPIAPRAGRPPLRSPRWGPGSPIRSSPQGPTDRCSEGRPAGLDHAGYAPKRHSCLRLGLIIRRSLGEWTALEWLLWAPRATPVPDSPRAQIKRYACPEGLRALLQRSPCVAGAVGLARHWAASFNPLPSGNRHAQCGHREIPGLTCPLCHAAGPGLPGAFTPARARRCAVSVAGSPGWCPAGPGP